MLSSNFPIVIDPTKLTDETSLLLRSLLKQCRKLNQPTILEKKIYQVSVPALDQLLDQATRPVILTHTLIHRILTDQSGKNKIHKYCVVGDALGKGQFGRVHEVLGTITLSTKNELMYKGKLSRVVKMQDINQGMSNEGKFSLSVPHLRAKNEIVDDTNSHKYMLMARLAGQPLSVILDNDKFNSIPTYKRIQIAINLFRALKEQIHVHGIVHRDIKPANVLVDVDTCSVFILDLGFGVEADNPVYVFCGSAGYMAPESITKKFPYDQRSDEYSMGLILRELFRAEPRKGRQSQVFTLIKNGVEPAKLDELFKDIQDLSDHQKKIIEEVIIGLSQFQPSQRCTSIQAIEKLEDVKLDFKISQVPLSLQGCYKVAHGHAIKLRSRLHDIAIDGSEAVLTLIREAINQSLDQLGDEACELSIFVDTVDIKAIQNCVSKESVLKKTEQILSNFEMMRAQLTELIEQIELFKQAKSSEVLVNHILIKDCDRLRLRADKLLAKPAKLLYTIDAIVEMNAKYEAKIFDFYTAFSLIQANEVTTLTKNVTDVASVSLSESSSIYASLASSMSKSESEIKPVVEQLPANVILETEPVSSAATEMNLKGCVKVDVEEGDVSHEFIELPVELSPVDAIRARITKMELELGAAVNAGMDSDSLSVAALKYDILRGLRGYISATYTPNGWWGGANRAGSLRRQNDIQGVLSALELSHDMQALINNVQTSLMHVETGYWGRSQLRDIVQGAILRTNISHSLNI